MVRAPRSGRGDPAARHRAARIRQRPQPRLPSGAARSHPRPVGRRLFWTWRERMYAVAAVLDPDSYYRLARAVYAEMALAGYHVASASSTTCTTARAGSRTTTRTRWATALSGGGRRRRHPADPARHLLPHRPTSPAAPLTGTQLRFRRPRRRALGRAAARPDRADAGRDRPGRCGDPLGPRGAEDQLPTVVAAADGLPLHVHLSEQPAENDAVPRRARRAPRPGC